MAGRYKGCEALSVAFWLPKLRSEGGLLFSNWVRDTPLVEERVDLEQMFLQLVSGGWQ